MTKLKTPGYLFEVTVDQIMGWKLRGWTREDVEQYFESFSAISSAYFSAESFVEGGKASESLGLLKIVNGIRRRNISNGRAAWVLNNMITYAYQEGCKTSDAIEKIIAPYKKHSIPKDNSNKTKDLEWTIDTLHTNTDDIWRKNICLALREITRMVRELEDAEEKYDVARINERVGMNADSLDVIRLKVEQHAADAAIHLPNVTKEKAESEKAPFEVGEYALWVGLNKESSIETGVVVKIDSIEKRPDFTSGWRITCSGMKVQFPIDLYEYDLSWFKKIVDPNEGDKQ